MTDLSHTLKDAHLPDDADTPAATPRPPLWSRVLRVSLAVGALMGLGEVCWSYRITDIDPDWRASLPVTARGLIFFVAIAVAIDAFIMLLGGIVWGGIIAIWRDVTAGDKPIRDRRFAIPWMVLALALMYLWVGWVGLFVFPSTAMNTTPYRVTMAAGIVGAFVVSTIVVWLLNRLSRVYRRLPTLGWAAAAATLLFVTLPPYSRLGRASNDYAEIPIGVEGVRPNVLLITLDTVRWDYIACYGRNRWIQTPTLNALAADGVIFEQAISQSPTTTPSHCSIMTSVYPNVHDAMNGKPMRPNLTTLAECMRENGYETVAFTAATTTRSINSGLDRGFERYVDSLVPWSEAFSRDEFQNLIVFYVLGIAQDSQLRGDVVTRRTIDWLSQREDNPFFCWVHYFDPHDPYEPPPPFDEMYTGKVDQRLPMSEARERYAGEITYTDREVGRVIDALKKRDLYDETFIVVVSDHGEAFGEKHWDYIDRNHGVNLFDTTQRVPLIIKPPRSLPTPRGRRIRDQVELIDIAPTILSTVNLPAPAGFAGRSLAGALLGSSSKLAARPAHAMTWVEVYNLEHRQRAGSFVRKVAHRTPDWKYVLVDHYDQEELYDLRRDPRERDNVSISRPDLCAERKAEVKASLHESSDIRRDPRSRLAPALRKQLEALGYLGGGNDAEQKDEKDGR